MKCLPLCAVVLTLCAVPAFAQPVLPPRVPQIVHELYARHVDLARGTDDERRALTEQIIEQIIWEFPADGYGWKSASPGRPPSKDCFARQFGAHLWCWDWQDGTTREPLARFLVHDITGQRFITMAGVDHLGSVPPAPDPPPPPDPLPACNLTPIEEHLNTLSGEVKAYGDLELEALAKVCQQATLEQHAKSLEEHREELRKVKSWARRWLVEKVLPIVGGVAAGWFSRSKDE